MERQVSGFKQIYESILHHPLNRHESNYKTNSLEAVDIDLGRLNTNRGRLNRNRVASHLQFANGKDIFLDKIFTSSIAFKKFIFDCNSLNCS